MNDEEKLAALIPILGKNPVLDLRGCGMGNIVLMTAAYLNLCKDMGARPRICHDRPSELGILRLPDDLQVSDESGIPDLDPRHTAALKTALCDLNMLILQPVLDTIGSIVKPVDPPLDMTGVEAGFCFRVTLPSLDGSNVPFMNEVAIARLLHEMRKYDRVLVCANHPDLLRRVLAEHPGAVTLGCVNHDTRNADHHILQFHALSRCPVVYHGVRDFSGKVPGVTSTFAAIAGVYGGSSLVGVDNAGRLHSGWLYHW